MFLGIMSMMVHNGEVINNYISILGEVGAPEDID